MPVLLYRFRDFPIAGRMHRFLPLSSDFRKRACCFAGTRFNGQQVLEGTPLPASEAEKAMLFTERMFVDVLAASRNTMDWLNPDHTDEGVTGYSMAPYNDVAADFERAGFAVKHASIWLVDEMAGRLDATERSTQARLKKQAVYARAPETDKSGLYYLLTGKGSAKPVTPRTARRLGRCISAHPLQWNPVDLRIIDIVCQGTTGTRDTSPLAAFLWGYGEGNLAPWDDTWIAPFARHLQDRGVDTTQFILILLAWVAPFMDRGFHPLAPMLYLMEHHEETGAAIRSVDRADLYKSLMKQQRRLQSVYPLIPLDAP